MKKIITIGRGEGADIVIEDDLVSRRHATIRLLPFGKMEIRDLSKNGTYVNGIRLAVNKPYPVTRKDVVSFARVSQLDWRDVPDPLKPYRIGVIALLAVIVVILAINLISRISRGDNSSRDGIEQYEEPGKVEKKSDDKDAEKDKADKSKDEKDKADAKEGEKVKNLFPSKEKGKTTRKQTDKKSDSQTKEGNEKGTTKPKDDDSQSKEQQTHWL